MLIGDADQRPSYPAQGGLVGQASVNPGPAFSTGLDRTFDQDLFLGGQAQGAQEILQGMIEGEGKKGFNPGFFRSLANRVRGGFFPQEEVDRLDNDRFTGPGFPGKDIQPFGK